MMKTIMLEFKEELICTTELVTKDFKKIYSNFRRNMMKIKKLILCINILFIILSCTNKKEDNLESISEYVNENYEKLEKIAKEYIKGNNVDYPKTISNISAYGKDDIYVLSNNIIVELLKYMD